MKNLLERLEVERRVQLSSYYAEKFPNTYKEILLDLENNFAFSDMKLGTAYDLAAAFQLPVGDIIYEFES